MPRLLLPFAAALCLFAAQATAQEHNHPTIVGVWKGEIDAVSITASDADAKPVFGTFTATLEITEQQDQRFAGTFTFEGRDTESIVGVFTEPGRILWSEPDGFAHGRVINGELIEVCYVRSSETDQVASCERYQRQE